MVNMHDNLQHNVLGWNEINIYIHTYTHTHIYMEKTLL